MNDRVNSYYSMMFYHAQNNSAQSYCCDFINLPDL